MWQPFLEYIKSLFIFSWVGILGFAAFNVDVLGGKPLNNLELWQWLIIVLALGMIAAMRVIFRSYKDKDRILKWTHGLRHDIIKVADSVDQKGKSEISRGTFDAWHNTLQGLENDFGYSPPTAATSTDEAMYNMMKAVYETRTSDSGYEILSNLVYGLGSWHILLVCS